MKNFFSTAFLLALLGFVIYEWGRFALNVFQHPARSFKVIVIPSLIICTVVWATKGILQVRENSRMAQDPAQVAKTLRSTMQGKTTEELIDIAYTRDRRKWTDQAIQAANETLKPRLFSSEGIDALARYRSTQL